MAASSYSKNEKSNLIQQYKDWFNGTFVNDPNIPSPLPSGLKAPEVGITIHSDLGTVVLPILRVKQNQTVRQIFLQAIHLLENAEQVKYLDEYVGAALSEEGEVEKSIQEQLPPGYDFDAIEYRKKTYIVHSHLEDSEYQFVVERQEDRKIIEKTKATGKHVVAAYQKKYPDKF